MSKTTLTRRRLATLVAAGAATAASNVIAQTPPATAPDFAKQAQDNLQRNTDALAAVNIPILTEPAFQFKA